MEPEEMPDRISLPTTRAAYLFDPDEVPAGSGAYAPRGRREVTEVARLLESPT